LAILTKKLKQSTKRPTHQLRDIIRVVKPETVFRWHSEMVRRKWTQEQKNNACGTNTSVIPIVPLSTAKIHINVLHYAS